MNQAIENAFLRLDDDMSKEALPKEGEVLNMKTLSVAMSGAVVCVAHIDGPHLHIANVGDSCAVLGKFMISRWQILYLMPAIVIIVIQLRMKPNQTAKNCSFLDNVHFNPRTLIYSCEAYTPPKIVCPFLTVEASASGTSGRCL